MGSDLLPVATNLVVLFHKYGILAFENVIKLNQKKICLNILEAQRGNKQGKGQPLPATGTDKNCRH